MAAGARDWIQTSPGCDISRQGGGCRLQGEEEVVLLLLLLLLQRLRDSETLSCRLDSDLQLLQKKKSAKTTV